MAAPVAAPMKVFLALLDELWLLDVATFPTTAPVRAPPPARDWSVTGSAEITRPVWIVAVCPERFGEEPHHKAEAALRVKTR